MLKTRLVQAGETLLGMIWWGFTSLWGGLMAAMFVLVPLLLANMAFLIREDLPATAALAGGVVGAYAINLPPWDADEPESLPLVIGGTALSVVLWDLMRSSADLLTLLVALGLTVMVWPIRRFIASRLQATGL